MPRPIPQHGEPVNGDSFLDIVASVVSIMIIMVVMVGMRIKNTPVTVAIPANPVVTELEKEVATEQSLRGDMARIAEQTRGLQLEAARRGLQRDVLATMVAAVEQKIQERRQTLDAAKQADFDLARGLSESKFQLDADQPPNRTGGQHAGRADRRRKLSDADQPRGRRPRGASADLERPRRVHSLGGAPGTIPIAGQAASLQAARTAGIHRHDRAGRRFSASLYARTSRRFARGDEDNRPRRQLRPAAALVADSDLQRLGRAGAAGACSRVPTSGERWPRFCPAEPRSPSGSIPTASTLSGRFARSYTPGLQHRRPAAAHRRADRRIAGREQVGRTIEACDRNH